MNMKDWIEFLYKFLELSSYPILLDNGKVIVNIKKPLYRRYNSCKFAEAGKEPICCK